MTSNKTFTAVLKNMFLSSSYWNDGGKWTWM